MLDELWIKDHPSGIHADLIGADLSGVNLGTVSSADLRGAGLIVIQLPIWTVYVHKDTIRIGCKHYTHYEWNEFTDDEIASMDSRALDWWKQNKEIILSTARSLKNVS